MRNEKQILAEIKALEELLPRIEVVAPSSVFGDDNVAAIKFQIEVLKKRMPEGAMYGQLLNYDNYVISAGQDVFNWMTGKIKTRQSLGWKQLADYKGERAKCR